MIARLGGCKPANSVKGTLEQQTNENFEVGFRQGNQSGWNRGNIVSSL